MRIVARLASVLILSTLVATPVKAMPLTDYAALSEASRLLSLMTLVEGTKPLLNARGLDDLSKQVFDLFEVASGSDNAPSQGVGQFRRYITEGLEARLTEPVDETHAEPPAPPEARTASAPGSFPVPRASAAPGLTWRPFDDPPQPRNQRSNWSLFRDVAGDVARFFTTPSSYAILDLGLAGTAVVAQFDDDVRNSSFNVQSVQPDDTTLDELFSPGHLLGSSNLQFGAALATYGVGSVVGTPRVAALGRDLVRAQLLTAGLTQFVKHTVRRSRPDGITLTSFPSGHASGTFASAAVFHRHFGWKAGIPAFAVASYVAASRITDNQHYLSDVVFGAVIGLAAGRTVTFNRGPAKIELSPLVVSRGAGVQVSVFNGPGA